jgi:C-terminal processing protease CtpA/Prc
LREPIELVFVPKEPVVSYLGLFDVEFFVVDSWQPRAPAIVQPLVVLTSSLTGSAAEHAARILQRHCGAVVIGERTAGAEAVVQEATCPNGAVLRFGSTRVVDRTGVGLQREGVAPDVSVRLTVADVEVHGAEVAQAVWERLLEAAARQALRRRGAR